jgi:hypothetical protein
MRVTMNGRQDSLARKRRASYGALKSRWNDLCGRYLPVAAAGSIWRYSRGLLPGDPEQGWKLHVSATILTAGRVLQVVAPLLTSRGVLYKAPDSLSELDKLNSGMHYGYSQVGKFLTVYPRMDEEAVLLAAALDRLTRGVDAPSVPFDARYRAGGCVYYRYGAFRALDFEDEDGERVRAIRDLEGKLVPDVRDSAAKPGWVSDPFLDCRPRRASKPKATPLQTTVRAFRALTQRGKGGVYHALDLSVTPPRLCVLKEGRKHGEVGWDGRDGYWRVRHERRVLASLSGAGINVPRVYASFRAEKNYYLSVEFIEGESFDRWLTSRLRRVTIAVALRRGAELAHLVARVHDAGWVWRDCKPGNVIVTRGGELRPLDFEGACPVERPDPLPWGTQPYLPPEGLDAFRGQSRLPEDLYALGATIYFLLAGRLPDDVLLVPLEKMRKNVPARVHRVLAQLLDPDPRRRPAALAVARSLETALKSLTLRRAQGGTGHTL